jgi:hypothetical protein
MKYESNIIDLRNFSKA